MLVRQHLDSVHDDVTDISTALLAAQSQNINEDSVTLCQVRLGTFAKCLGSIQDDVNNISEALVAAQSINNDSVTLCQVRLVCQRLDRILFRFIYMVLGQVSSQNVWMDSAQDDVTDISDALLTSQSINEDSVTWCQVWLGQFAKRFGSIQDDITDIGDALLTAQNINEDSITWC